MLVSVSLNLVFIAQTFGQFNFPIESYSYGYYAHLGAHPGVFVTANHRLSDNLKVKNRKKGEKIIRKGWMTSVSMAYYHHTGNQNVFVPGIDFYRLRTSTKPAFREYGFGPKLVAGFNVGETYLVSDMNADPEKKHLAASYNFALSTHYLAGWKFKNKSANPFHVTLGPQVLWVFNYNNTVVPYVNLMVGFKKNIDVYYNSKS